MKLDLSSLKSATASLQRGIERSQRDTNDEEVRDAVIQRFEYTYELCWKMLRRHLGLTSPSPAAIDQLSFKELMREAIQQGLTTDFDAWLEYRNQRNITTHTYNRQKAQSVYDSALRFHEHAKSLLRELERRNAD